MPLEKENFYYIYNFHRSTELSIFVYKKALNIDKNIDKI